MTEDIGTLFATPSAERDADWHTRFDAVVPAAPMRLGEPFTGPDGFPYVALHRSGTGSSVADRIDACLADGTGIVVYGPDGAVEWVFNYGGVWSYRAFGTFDAWPPGAEPRPSSSRQIFTGAPSDAMVPPYASAVLRVALERLGVEPLVMLVQEPDAVPPMSLMFPVYADAYPDHASYDYVMQGLVWYLPRHYGLLGGVRSFADDFVPL
jgi:hypothetical protein